MAFNLEHKKNLKVLFYGSQITIFILIFFYIIGVFLTKYHFFAQFDSYFLNLIQSYRTPFLNQFMLFITYLASWPSIVIAFSLLSICLILLRQWHYLTTFIISLSLGQIYVFFVKNLIERHRPPISQALTFESSFSFPSAHTFIAFSFFGLLIYFFIHTSKSKITKSILAIFGSILIFSIGLSRVYLGAHWPSDIIASFLAGIVWVFTLIIFNEVSQHYPPHTEKPALSKSYLNKIYPILLFIYIAFLFFNFFSNQIIP